MSVPVAPNTIPHPLGRNALSASLPLPWPNCHHSAFATVEVRTRSAWTNAPSPWNYDADELYLYDRMLRLDLQRSTAAREAAAAGLSPLPPPPPHQECEESAGDFDPIVVDPDFAREIYYRCQFPGVQGPELQEKMYASSHGGPCSCNECTAPHAQDKDIFDWGNLKPGSDPDLSAALLGMMLTEGRRRICHRR